MRHTNGIKTKTHNYPQSTQPEKKRINILESLEFQPLIFGLKKGHLQHNFELVTCSPAKTAQQLLEGSVELSLIHSIEYARKKEIWRIIPDICVSCSGTIKNIQLFFNRGLKDIKSIAVDPEEAMALVLLKIIIKEKFMINPEIITIRSDLENMLAKADAALIAGDKAFEYYYQNRSRLDLNEEWVDLTGLPFVYAFWAGREFTINKDELNTIKTAHELGKKNFERIAKKFARLQSGNWSFYHDFLMKTLNYRLGDREIDGLMEFYNYAFFYGFIDFIPDLHFY